jgi:hypothetical protein
MWNPSRRSSKSLELYCATPRARICGSGTQAPRARMNSASRRSRWLDLARPCRDGSHCEQECEGITSCSFETAAASRSPTGSGGRVSELGSLLAGSLSGHFCANSWSSRSFRSWSSRSSWRGSVPVLDGRAAKLSDSSCNSDLAPVHSVASRATNRATRFVFWDEEQAKSIRERWEGGQKFPSTSGRK